jgi:hypothetical protein
MIPLKTAGGQSVISAETFSVPCGRVAMPSRKGTRNYPPAVSSARSMALNKS